MNVQGVEPETPTRIDMFLRFRPACSLPVNLYYPSLPQEMRKKEAAKHGQEFFHID